MSLRKIFNLSEAEGDAVPEPMPEKPRPDLARFFKGTTMPPKQPARAAATRQIPTQGWQAGQGPESDGVPTDAGETGGGRKPPAIGEPVDQSTAKMSYTSKTIPNPRQNVGGTGTPPRSAGAFSRAPNAPQDEPLPDLPLESRLRRLFGIQREDMTPSFRRAGLIELYHIDEMPRPAGSYGKPVMAMLQWAKEQGGREFTARDLFRVWRQSGGQPNQGDDRKAYASFQTSVRQFIDARGRGTPEQPIVIVQAGSRGRGGAAVYRWGAARPSQTAAGKPMPGATAFDDMELGPAGAAHTLARQPQAAADADDEEMPEMEPNPMGEPEPEEPEQQSAEDEMDWIPEPTEDTQVGRAMIALNEQDPEKLQDLLMAIPDCKTVLDAATKAIGMFGRGTTAGRHAILIAKQSAANLGLPDPDEVL